MMLPRRAAFFCALAAAGGALLAAFVAACSSDSGAHTQPPAGCAGAPFACPAGQTCAIANDALEMTCQPSGAGKAGGPCQNVLDAPPQCGDGLFCLQAPPNATQQLMPGECVAFCDSAHPCTGAAMCKEAQIVANGAMSPIVNICFSGFPDGAVPPPVDGGTTDAPATDAPPPSDAPPPPADAPSDGPTE
jgi:hypothetical protein